MTSRIGAIAVLVLGISSTQAVAALSEHEARDKATQILLGDPYGNSQEEITGNLKKAQLLSDGKTLACGQVNKPVWQFHVVVKSPVNNPASPIDGYLVIDANSGTMVCANLPMLD